MRQREEIQGAFSKTPYPGDEALRACPCEECRWEVRCFRGKRWSRLRPEDVSAADGGNVAALTPAAFHYFLPGFLLLILDQPEEVGTLVHSIIDRLATSDREGDEGLQRVNRNIKQLTMRQRRVLASFLNLLREKEPHVPEVWRSAIENLLSKKVQSYSQATVEQWLAEKCGWHQPPASRAGHQQDYRTVATDWARLVLP